MTQSMFFIHIYNFHNGFFQAKLFEEALTKDKPFATGIHGTSTLEAVEYLDGRLEDMTNTLSLRKTAHKALQWLRDQDIPNGAQFIRYNSHDRFWGSYSPSGYQVEPDPNDF